MDNVPEEVELLIEGLDETNITSLLNKWNEVTAVKKKIEELDDILKNKIKVYLKERNWDKYTDDNNKISVTISEQKKETVDMKQLKVMLTEAQLAQVVHITTYEKMLILTPEARERLKNYVRKTKL